MQTLKYVLEVSSRPGRFASEDGKTTTKNLDKALQFDDYDSAKEFEQCLRDANPAGYVGFYRPMQVMLTIPQKFLP